MPAKPTCYTRLPDCDLKRFSAEVRIILNRVPLLSPKLFSIIVGPTYQKYVDTEFDKNKKREPLPPPFWSQDLERLYQLLSGKDWMVLHRAFGELYFELEEARHPFWWFTNNEVKRTNICQDLDKLDKLEDEFMALRRLRFRYVDSTLEGRKTTEEEEEICKNAVGAVDLLGIDDITHIQDAITAHARARKAALTSAKSLLPKSLPPQAQSGNSTSASTESKREPLLDLAVMMNINEAVGTSSALAPSTTDKLALTGPHLRHYRGNETSGESTTSVINLAV